MFGTGMSYVTQRAADKDEGILVFLALEPQYVQSFEQVFYNM
jgi:shikimate O-hydroxycinnamoyltransferase